ncbi:hypothetical protein ACQJBY_038771 [Aegilops geniculata]
MLMRAEGGGLGFLFQLGCNVQLWKRKIDSDGDASWVLGRTFELDKILSLNLTEKESTMILCLAEYNNVLLVRTAIGDFMVQLESLQFKKIVVLERFKKIFEPNCWHSHQPFECVFTRERCAAGGDYGAELLIDT